MNWGQILIGGGFGATLVGGIVALVKAFWRRPLIKVEAATELSDQAVDMVRQVRDDALAQIKQARDDAAAARQDATTARQDAEEARRQAAEARNDAWAARRDAESALREFHRLTDAIMAPYATLEMLRAMVAEGPGNGVATHPVR